ncbi:MAG: ABC transporter substrate-binding protein, partial [Desulfomonilaceae bacterium]
MDIRRIVLALSMALLLLAGTAWAGNVPGVTDTEVVIGCTTPLSGPAALWGTTGMGMKAWAD